MKIAGIVGVVLAGFVAAAPAWGQDAAASIASIVWIGYTPFYIMAGLNFPPNTPRPILDKLNREVNKALQLPDVKQRLDQLGLEIEGGTAEKSDVFIKSQATRLTELIKAGAVQVE